MTDATALLAKYRAAGPAETREAQAWLARAREAEDQKKFGVAAKAYGEAALRKPSAVALAGHARSLVLDPLHRSTPEQARLDKERTLPGLARYFEVALVLADQTGESLPPGFRDELSAHLRCIQQAMARAPAVEQLCPPSWRKVLAGQE